LEPKRKTSRRRSLFTGAVTTKSYDLEHYGDAVHRYWVEVEGIRVEVTHQVYDRVKRGTWVTIRSHGADTGSLTRGGEDREKYDSEFEFIGADPKAHILPANPNRPRSNPKDFQPTRWEFHETSELDEYDVKLDMTSMSSRNPKLIDAALWLMVAGGLLAGAVSVAVYAGLPLGWKIGIVATLGVVGAIAAAITNDSIADWLSYRKSARFSEGMVVGRGYEPIGDLDTSYGYQLLVHFKSGESDNHVIFDVSKAHYERTFLGTHVQVGFVPDDPNLAKVIRWG
jgi:hypothetical protein